MTISMKSTPPSIMTDASENMWSHLFPAPIHVFNVELFGIPISTFVNDHQPVFDALPADPYDARKERIEFLLQKVKPSDPASFYPTFKRYYVGDVTIDALDPLYQQLTQEEKAHFGRIVPYRFRAISRYKCDFSDPELNVHRVPVEKTFVQRDNLLEEGKFDFRTLPRIFTDLEEEWSLIPSFQQVLKGVSAIIYKMQPHLKGLDITIHHVRVKTSVNRITSNSPEGIHQDGFPFIVSALVVERVNVSGGESQIFGDDRQTKLFTTTLMPGFGLLQPDLDTSLWHCVSKIEPTALEGHRSSIGFDIQPIE